VAFAKAESRARTATLIAEEPVVDTAQGTMCRRIAVTDRP